MGFIKKLTGADKAAKAIEKQAAQQATAARQAAQAAALALNQQTFATAQAQQDLSAREAASQAAAALQAEAAPTASDVPAVLASAPSDTPQAEIRRRRRVQFGTGVTGVQI